METRIRQKVSTARQWVSHRDGTTGAAAAAARDSLTKSEIRKEGAERTAAGAVAGTAAAGTITAGRIGAGTTALHETLTSGLLAQ